MKSPNSQTEESLRKLMSQRFESYEKEPSESLMQSVFDQLRARRRHRITQILLAGFLLVCICIVGRLLYVSQQKQKTYAALSKNRSLPKQSPATSRETQLSKSYASESRRDNLLERTGKTAGKKNTEFNRKRRPAELTFDPAMTPPSSTYELTDQSIPVQHPSENENLTEPLHILDNKPVSSYNPVVQMPELVDNKEYIPIDNTNDNHGYKLIVGLIPTSSFQLLDVMPEDGLIYQNFRFAKPVSRRALGYKFQVGIERVGVQFLLNYSQFSHAVTYDVAGGEFVLIRDAQNNASPVRKTTTIHDDNSVRQLGVGLKKHHLLTKGALRMHYFDFGAEFTKQLGGDNNALWLNTSFGKQVQILGHASLTIGPYVEYSLHKFKNAGRVYTSTPYQVGVSMGLRLSN